MNAKPWRSLITALTVLLSATGCGRQTTYQTRLAPDEKITEKAPVIVDDVPAGVVKELRVESGERIAVFMLTDERFPQGKLKAGTIRMVEDGRIHLRTDLVRAESPILQAGAFIPIQNKTEFTVKKYATNQTLVFVGVVLVAVLVLCLVFKKAFNLGLVILCLALAGLTGWILHPHLVPRIEKFYASSPAIQNVANASEQNSASGSSTSTPIKKWETTFVQVLEHRPNPRVAAFAAILVLSFIPYAILLGSAVRSLSREQ